ncbi:MAG: response regulator transcription factor, partial [Anaerolineales bacterium]|nr:response regulator transcription factor [Anaerolineales bacterium]
MARVLIIDDDVELLDMLRMVLGQSGQHEVTLIADAADGLAKALSDTPDLAIIDLMMPQMSGYELLRRLRAERQTASLPVIMLTARGQPIDRAAAM